MLLISNCIPTTLHQLLATPKGRVESLPEQCQQIMTPALGTKYFEHIRREPSRYRL